MFKLLTIDTHARIVDITYITVNAYKYSFRAS